MPEDPSARVRSPRAATLRPRRLTGGEANPAHKRFRGGEAEPEAEPVSEGELDEDDLYELRQMQAALVDPIREGVCPPLEALRPIGRGTFSTVFLARNPVTGEKLALKKLVPTSIPARYFIELESLRLCQGKNYVIPIKFCYRKDNNLLLAMPYIKQIKFVDLAASITYAEMREYLKHLLKALVYIHQLRIVHRDVKPPNFLYNRVTKQYALVDFGLAQRYIPERDDPGEATTARGPLIAARSVNALNRSHSNRQSQQLCNVNPYLAQTAPYKLLEAAARGIGGGMPASTAARIASSTTAIVAKSRTHGDQFFSPNQGRLEAERLKKRRIGTNSTIVNPPLQEQVRRSPRKHPSSKGGGSKANAGYSTLTISGSAILGGSTAANLKRTSSFTVLDPTSGVPSDNQTPLMQASVTSRFSQQSREASNLKYLTPTTSELARCICYGKGKLCSKCVNRAGQRVNRAGTPGFRPPEVLLKYPCQTTAVDMWAAGVILLSLMSRTYPFFRAHDDMMNLAEIMNVFGSHKVKEAASTYGKVLVTDQELEPLPLDNLCRALSARKMDISGSQTPRNNLVTHNSVQLLKGLLDLIAEDRLSAEEALDLPFFEDSENDCAVEQA